MRLNHNMNSLALYQGYKKNIRANSLASERISSGSRINSAKDNPMKIGQSELMRIQIKSLQAAEKNVQDGVSMLQTADGALQEVSGILTRLKDLTVEASTETNSDEDLEALQNEIEQMKLALDDISKNTQFNGVKILAAEGVTDNSNPLQKRILVGTRSGENLDLDIYNTSTSVIGKNKEDLTDTTSLKDVDVTAGNAASSISIVDRAIRDISEIRSKYGAKSNVLESKYDTLNEMTETVEGADSRIRDADIAVEAMEFSRTQLLTNAGIGLIVQSNKLPQECLMVLQNSRK